MLNSSTINLSNNKYIVNCNNGERMLLEIFYNREECSTIINPVIPTSKCKKQTKRGLDKLLGESIKYNTIKESSCSNTCLICIDNFSEEDLVRKLQKCKHIYHKECIDKWIIKNPTCPICRTLYSTHETI